MDLELRRLSREGVAAALEKAERYRLLNEASEAESICRDVLEVEPESERALVILLLSLTDQLSHRASAAAEAREVLARLKTDYDRAYYEGLIHERLAKSRLKRGGPSAGFMAYDEVQKALACYDRAAALREPGNDEAILRWNTCVRLLERHPELKPEPEEAHTAHFLLE